MIKSTTVKWYLLILAVKQRDYFFYCKAEPLAAEGVWYSSGIAGRRPFIYDESEVQRIKELLVAEESCRLSYVQSKIEHETGKSASKRTLGKVVKKLGIVYKRFRKSCKHKRNEEQFRR